MDVDILAPNSHKVLMSVALNIIDGALPVPFPVSAHLGVANAGMLGAGFSASLGDLMTRIENLFQIAPPFLGHLPRDDPWPLDSYHSLQSPYFDRSCRQSLPAENA